MFYTNKSISIVYTLYNYLLLIQQSNNRYEDKRSTLARYDDCKEFWQPIRLMNRRTDIVSQMERWEKLSAWLVKRYLRVKNELDIETFKRTSQSFSANELLKLHSIF